MIFCLAFLHYFTQWFQWPLLSLAWLSQYVDGYKAGIFLKLPFLLHLLPGVLLYTTGSPCSFEVSLWSHGFFLYSKCYNYYYYHYVFCRSGHPQFGQWESHQGGSCVPLTYSYLFGIFLYFLEKSDTPVSFQAPAPESALIPLSRKWYLETRIWVLRVLSSC